MAPALNLTTVLAPGSSAPRWQRFLDLQLAARIARITDVLDLQAQSLERSPASYANFVREAATQARSANPGRDRAGRAVGQPAWARPSTASS